MEKIAQSSASSQLSSVITDLSKNLVKVDASNNSNFKDYIKTNSPLKSESIYKKQDSYKQNDVRSGDKNKAIHDEEKKFGKTPIKRDTQNIKQDASKEETRNNNDDSSASENNQALTSKDIKQINSKKNEKIKENIAKNEEEVNLQNFVNIIVAFADNPVKLEQELKLLSKEEVLQLDNAVQNMPDIILELKNVIQEFTGSLKENDYREKLSLLKNTENPFELKDEESFVPDVGTLEKQTVAGNVVKTSVDNLDLTGELTSLKSELSLLSGGVVTEELHQNNDTQEFVEENDHLAISDMINANVKIFANNNTRIFTEAKASGINPENIQNLSKIADEMTIAFRDNKTTINIKLEPETLGKLSIKIHSENGVLNASFFVESDKAKQAIEQQIQVLKQALNDQNINIQDINVQVGQGNEDLNYHKNIMEAINFSKRVTLNGVESEDLSESINPYLQEDLFNDLI